MRKRGGEFVNMWVAVSGDDATYSVMIIAMLKGKKRKHATDVCKMLSPGE